MTWGVVHPKTVKIIVLLLRLFSSKDEFSLKKIVESEDQTSKHPDDVIEEIAEDGPKTSFHILATM